MRVFLCLWAAVCLSAADFEEVDLFRQGEAGVHTYRIPALVQTRKGTLLAVVDARHDTTSDLPARISLVMRRSTDGGRHWSEMQTLREVKEGGVGDASLLLDQGSGRVWCMHAYGPPGSASEIRRQARTRSR
jgi:sialidase-1